jgi:hypothetical protein
MKPICVCAETFGFARAGEVSGRELDHIHKRVELVLVLKDVPLFTPPHSWLGDDIIVMVPIGSRANVERICVPIISSGRR